jgi:hypothetical protein
MHCDVWLRLLCASLIPTFCACGRITHDIGQIRNDSQKSDGSVASTPVNALDAGRRFDVGTDSAGTVGVLERPDASFDGSQPDGRIVWDADMADVMEYGEIDIADALDASDDAPDNECFEERIEIEVVPFGVDIYIMMDALLFSGFWTFPTLTPDETLLWSEVRQEISTFVDDPYSEGTGVGIQYYGRIDLDGDPTRPTYCEVSTYEEPAVSIAELPDNAEEIKASFPINPFNASPVVPALEGAILHAKGRVPAYPGRKQVVFLITGTSGIFDPFCESSIENLNNAAEQGYMGDPSIATYVIGIYAFDIDFSPMTTFLRDVAMKGGTSRPYLASLNRQDPELAQKLGEARDAAKLSACGFNLPQGYQDGLPEGIDPYLASIVITTDDDETIELQTVRDHSFCNPDEPGWYFDDPDNPSSLVACERTCEILNSASISYAELQLTCPN